MKRPSLPSVPRGELRDLPYLDRSGRSRDRRDHQFPLQREAFDRPCDETRSRRRALWQSANRMAMATTRCTQFSLFVRNRGDRADFDKMYARHTPSLTDERG